jgi:hypothetical protein
MPKTLLRLVFLLLAACNVYGQGTKDDYERALSLDRRTTGKVFRTTVTPRWLPGGNAFWYRVDTAPGQSEHVFVDATKGERRGGLNAQTLAEVLTQVLGRRWNPMRCRVKRPGMVRRRHRTTKRRSPSSTRRDENVTIIWVPDGGGERRTYATLKPGEKHPQHTFVGHRWRVETSGGKRLGTFVGQPDESTATIREDATEENGRSARTNDQPTLPPREWTAFIRDHNVWIRHRDTNDEVQLSTDGKPDDPYRGAFSLVSRWNETGRDAGRTGPGAQGPRRSSLHLPIRYNRRSLAMTT